MFRGQEKAGAANVWPRCLGDPLPPKKSQPLRPSCVVFFGYPFFSKFNPHNSSQQKPKPKKQKSKIENLGNPHRISNRLTKRQQEYNIMFRGQRRGQAPALGSLEPEPE